MESPSPPLVTSPGGLIMMADMEVHRLRRITRVLSIIVFVLLVSLLAFAVALTNSRVGSESMTAVWENTLSNAKYVDLTHSFAPTTPVWGGFNHAQFGPAVAGSNTPGLINRNEAYSYARQGFVATSYTVPTDQYGTQLDTPAHWNEYGSTVSDIPSTVALRPLVVINIADKVKRDPGYHAKPSDVHAWERAHGQVPRGSVVMFRSDWSLRWDEYARFGVPTIFPGVQLSTLKLLHEERAILFHGHEPLDTDMTPSLEGEAWLMHHNFMQAEGVMNLHRVPEHGALVTIGFAKALGGTTGLARFVAVCPPDWTDGATVWAKPGAPLATQVAPLRRNSAGVLQPNPEAVPTRYCSSEDTKPLGCPLPS